ncbi:MAG: hypothetical protein N2V78_05060 [Methanophagales archaeon]|nr:hypothetical protein [Methanophagales archaeon]
MSYDAVIDSYAWIEYFKGSGSGRRAEKYIESENAPVLTGDEHFKGVENVIYIKG